MFPVGSNGSYATRITQNRSKNETNTQMKLSTEKEQECNYLHGRTSWHIEQPRGCTSALELSSIAIFGNNLWSHGEFPEPDWRDSWIPWFEVQQLTNSSTNYRSILWCPCVKQDNEVLIIESQWLKMSHLLVVRYFNLIWYFDLCLSLSLSERHLIYFHFFFLCLVSASWSKNIVRNDGKAGGRFWEDLNTTAQRSVTSLGYQRCSSPRELEDMSGLNCFSL